MSPPLIITLGMCMNAVVILGCFSLWLNHRSRRRSLPDDILAEELRQLRESVDAVSVEVERIGESQRFTAKLLHEASTIRPTFPAAPAKSITPH